ncbi:MAG TPA: MFS transporter, partial [Candidatus Ozemobacteraceae bacterium]|nr:MFS transporter [Candidatus Ozemobacteraceae bacterium]
MSAETWKFPKEFWLANFMELCERAAYYGFFIVLTLFLTDIVGFSDKETGVVAGVFYALLYLLPPFVGAFCDKIGFRYGMIVAFALLTVGYTLLGIFHGKLAVIIILGILMLGGSFIKPLITGTVAKTTNEANRARAYSLFYWVVNLGAFGGKTVVPYVRQGMGLEYVNFFSAGMSLLALLFAIFMFKNVEGEAKSDKTIGQVFTSLKAIFLSPRLMALTLVVAGFWIIQQQ